MISNETTKRLVYSFGLLEQAKYATYILLYIDKQGEFEGLKKELDKYCDFIEEQLKTMTNKNE